MAASGDTGGRWESQAEVDACLRETGVTMDQVRRWRREGLLLDVEQAWPEAYHGSEVSYPASTCAQIKAAIVRAALGCLGSTTLTPNRKGILHTRVCRSPSRWASGFIIGRDL